MASPAWPALSLVVSRRTTGTRQLRMAIDAGPEPQAARSEAAADELRLELAVELLYRAPVESRGPSGPDVVGRYPRSPRRQIIQS